MSVTRVIISARFRGVLVKFHLKKGQMLINIIKGFFLVHSVSRLWHVINIFYFVTYLPRCIKTIYCIHIAKRWFHFDIYQSIHVSGQEKTLFTVMASNYSILTRNSKHKLIWFCVLMCSVFKWRLHYHNILSIRMGGWVSVTKENVVTVFIIFINVCALCTCTYTSMIQCLALSK